MKSPNYRKKSKKHIDKSIAIIGHMGSGKTLIGKLIAKELTYRFFDRNKLIEKNTHKQINERINKISLKLKRRVKLLIGKPDNCRLAITEVGPGTDVTK